jgi:ribosomal protein S8E
VYNASNNELVRTKTLVKNAIVVVDATPFRQWYEAHYALPLGRKKNAKLVSIIYSNKQYIYLFLFHLNSSMMTKQLLEATFNGLMQFLLRLVVL